LFGIQTANATNMESKHKAFNFATYKRVSATAKRVSQDSGATSVRPTFGAWTMIQVSVICPFFTDNIIYIAEIPNSGGCKRKFSMTFKWVLIAL